MKLAIVLLAILAALMAVSGETKSPSPAAAAGGTATIVGATGAAAAGSTVPAIVKAGIPISVGNLTTTSGATTATVQGATTGVTITGTGATGGFVGQPTIVGATGATVSIASPGAAIVGAAGASPAASGAAVISQASPSAAASGAASPAASGAASPAASAVVIVISPSPAASRAASPAASGAASPAASGAASPAASGAASPAASAVVIVISPSPAASGAASPAASGAASPAASGAASPAASGAASPAASGAASPVVVASPAALVSAADFFPPMPTYGQENLQFTCPNATTQAMVEVSLEPLLIGINQVSSIKFAGCPSLMYVATKAGQIFEVTIDNSTSAVTQVRLILDLSNEIASPSTQASTTAGGGTSGGISGGASTMAGGGSTSGGISGGASTTAGGTSGGISGGASASSNAADQPGLLGMAFPPDFADSGLFYVYFSARSSSAAAGGAGGAASATTGGGASSATAGGATIAPSAGGATCGNESTMLNHVNRLAEYRLDRSSGIANFSRTLLELRWPFANGNGDNSLEFAPGSRLLFLGVGDGGSSFDPFENAQNPDVLLGKVHVFDLSSLSPNASCNQTVLRLSELNNRCPDIAAAITTFATGLHSPAGFEFLNPSAALEAASCPGGANATMAGGANATAAGGANATTAGGANATAAGGANATMAGGANATAAGGANATMAGGMNLTLSDLAPRLIAPDRGQGRYDEINIMEEIGANYGWDIIEGWSCIDQSLELCPESTSGMANATLAANRTAGGANATMAGGANATAAGGANATAAGGANATMAGGANATRAGGANLTATSMAVLPAAVIPHNCRRLYDPQAILGGRLYQGSELDPMLQGAYIFGATTSLQNGNESLPTGNGALYFLRPESFVGNAMADLTMCPATVAAGGANATAAGGANATMAGGANATAAGGANATMAGGANATAAGGANATMAGGANATAAGGANATMGGITTTGSGVNTSFIPNSRLEVFPVTINYQFFPTQHFFSAMGADASRSRLFLGVSSTQGATGGLGGVFRLIPFNEGPQNPAIISATNLRPGQIVFSAGGANATMAGGANATASPSPSAAASPSRSG